MEWTKEDFSISTDKSKIDVHHVHRFLSSSYWAENIPFEVVQRSVDGSLCFGVYHIEKQIGLLPTCVMYLLKKLIVEKV